MTSPFQDALREQLRAAAHRDLSCRRGRRRLRIGAAVAAVAAAIAGVAVLVPSPAAADVEVTIRDGVVEVRLTDLDATAAEVTEAMRDAGLEAETIGTPVGPSLVGRFVAVGFDQGGDAEVEDIRAEDGGLIGFRVPAGWEGRLRIQLGEAADPGEPYGAGSDAFAPGEPLGCKGVLGATLADASSTLDDLEVTFLPHGYVGDPIPLASPDAEPYARWHIVSGRARAADTVLLTVQADPLRHPEERGC
jgi:hypothetical protein